MMDRVSNYLDGILGSIETATPRTLDICMDAFQFLLNNVHRPVSIEELSEAAHCGVRTLYRAYDMAVQTTPVDHSNRIRVTRGRSLLFSQSPTQLSLKSIAEQCGFSTLKTFLNAYKAEFGLTPHQTVALYQDSRSRMLNSKFLSVQKS
jgi:transcriptional regulator GlxA family with amidase domain